MPAGNSVGTILVPSWVSCRGARLGRARACPGECCAPLVRAQLLGAAATIAFQQADFQAAHQFTTEGLPLFREAGDQEGICYSLD